MEKEATRERQPLHAFITVSAELGQPKQGVERQSTHTMPLQLFVTHLCQLHIDSKGVPLTRLDTIPRIAFTFEHEIVAFAAFKEVKSSLPKEAVIVEMTMSANGTSRAVVEKAVQESQLPSTFRPL